MNIGSLGRERQQGLHGMFMNVPIDSDKTVDQSLGTCAIRNYSIAAISENVFQKVLSV